MALPNIHAAYSGIVNPMKFIDFSRRPDDLSDRRIHPESSKGETLSYTIIIIVISAIIFVSVIAIYDVFRSLAEVYFANHAVEGDDIHRANQATIWASLTFAIFCLVTAVILLPLLILSFHLVGRKS